MPHGGTESQECPPEGPSEGHTTRDAEEDLETNWMHMFKWLVLGLILWMAMMVLLLELVVLILEVQSRTECTPPDEEGGIEFCITVVGR